MGCSLHFFIHLLVISLLALRGLVFAQNGIQEAEREALLALADELNNSFLHNNWTSLNCYNIVMTPYWYGVKCTNGRVAEVVLENMGLTGKIRPDTLFNLTELSVLSLKNNSISGNMMDFSQNQKLTQIDMSSNMFDGLISNSLPGLAFLESLQLQDNMLAGSIPAFNQSSLKEFNVSNNGLTGAIPNTKVLQSFNSSSFSGNPQLCGSPSYNPCSPSNNDTSSDNSPKPSGVSRFAPILLVIDVVGFIVVVFLFMIYCRKSKQLSNAMNMRSSRPVEGVRAEKAVQDIEVSQRSEGYVESEGGEGGGGERGKLTFMDGVERGFGLHDLLKASAEGLGKGNFGNCYKAMVDDGPAVVVKRLRELRPLSHSEFAKQLQALADLKHPNLLPLLAYYYSKEEKLLVHKLASNGNVYNRIHGGRGTRGRVPFRWTARLSVARAVARAMDYLHLNPPKSTTTTTTTTVFPPHGNLKSSNVLLDNDLVLVSDYSLASLISLPIAAQRMVSYKSPEFQNYKRLSKKSDVWSFGCLLLELLTGRVSAHSSPPGVNGVDLCGWVHRAVREEWTAEIFDVEIAVQRSATHSMLRLLQIAIRCCEKAPEKRPDMAEVAREIENIKVVVDSEDSEDLSQSITDDSMSMSATPSIMNGH
ncbi:hypothetical protein HYC85_024412 [Camellia sinensis]|uniref:Protein kinase domain-containing protein n=1 Tax=Camellia sinensis TaxID=4442 RepID=A0A7J7GC86_CAMSI|nr:hypothetical protein HYC85_024412 [Camellia sinensis]